MKCDKCQVELDENGYCPKCRTRYISISESVDFRDGYILKKKDKHLYQSQKHPYYYEEKNINRDRGQFVKRRKVEDRLNHKYEEDVETLDGEVIHSCHQSIFDHKNHGNAKGKNQK